MHIQLDLFASEGAERQRLDIEDLKKKQDNLRKGIFSRFNGLEKEQLDIQEKYTQLIERVEYLENQLALRVKMG